MKSKNFFKQLFDDDNTINEKAVIGFIAFFMIMIVFTIDIIASFMGLPFMINRFIFDGFMIIILGSFGIASVDKWINKHDNNKDNNNTPPTE
jgi:hypothetical protein